MKQTIIKKIAQTIVGSSLLLGPVSYAEFCPEGSFPVPVMGKITNNGQAPGAGFTTLGVVDLQLGKRPRKLARMKCGIIGVDAATAEEPFAFTHTLSCDDRVPVDLSYYGLGTQITHSQLTLDTHGDIFPEGSCAPLPGNQLSFIEHSTPSANDTGRGLFTGVTEGELTIEGTVNCLGSIDMKFDGYICMIPPTQ